MMVETEFSLFETLEDNKDLCILMTIILDVPLTPPNPIPQIK